MAIDFLTGQRLTADLLNRNVNDFFPTTYTKVSATSRPSTVTPTDDTELAGVSLGVGVYEIEVLLFWLTTASNVPGMRTRWAFSGTWQNAHRLCTGPGATNTGDPSLITPLTSQGYLFSQEAVYGSSTSAAYTASREVSRNVTVSVAGSMSLQWAQRVSSANATVLQAPSSITIRKMS